MLEIFSSEVLENGRQVNYEGDDNVRKSAEILAS